jgi:glucosyl-dolichyl phosphate glucuronosyltransferase
VVIATRDRPEILRRSLSSLLADVPGTAREIIVVDNGGNDGTAALVVELAERHPWAQLRVVSEPRVGLSNARNRGVSEVQGDAILFLDDDILVSQGWTDALCGALDRPRVVAATGRVVPFWDAPPPSWMDWRNRDMLCSPDRGVKERELLPHEHLTGGNAVVRASVLAQLGDKPFRVDLGHAGNQVMGGDDVAFTRSVRDLGSLWYEPSATGRHIIPRKRVDRAWLRRRHYQGGIGLAVLEPRAGEQATTLRALAGGVRRARRARSWNNHREEQTLSADEVHEEFLAYMVLGSLVASFTARVPQLRSVLRRIPV